LVHTALWRHGLFELSVFLSFLTREPPVLGTPPSYLSSWKNQVTVYPLPYHLH
jgi:hypothetical protein